MSAEELVALVCCDLGSIVRGRSVFLSELDRQLETGVGWVPANQALTPLGQVAEPNPFGSTGDLRLLPDPGTHVRVGPALNDGAGALEFLLCDIVEMDGRPWACCPRHFLRETLATLEDELGARLQSSFEHEFQLTAAPGRPPLAHHHPPAGAIPTAPAGGTAVAGPHSPPPFSLEAIRMAEPFAGDVMAALVEAGVQPERFFAEYAANQFEIPVDVADGLDSADRSVVFTEVVREIARRHGLRASFSPMLDLDDAGNGVHIHFSLLDRQGSSLLYDASRPAYLSEVGGSFAAGILRHARALNALTAPSPVSAARLRPHRWSAGAVCLGRQNREALLRIVPLVELGGGDPARQFHLEYRGADGAANPHLALAALLLAGLAGVHAELPCPPVLDRDPAELGAEEEELYRVGSLPGSLEDALRALEEDDTARSWMNPLLHEAYLSVKRAEVEAVSEWEPAERCRRYAEIY
jgi:glutamine synthetase